MNSTAVPLIGISALFRGPGAAREATDAAVMGAAADSGFLSVTGLPEDIPVDRGARADLLRIFGLAERSLRALWRRKFAPGNYNVYRGWFALQPGNLTSKEGIDLGADLAYGAGVVRPADPLRELTPLPVEADLPGWRSAAATYYLAMERVCAALMRSLARSLGLAEGYFDDAFRQGLSTLRLVRYPQRTPQELATCADPALWTTHAGARRYLTGAAHTDSGFLTLLAQDGVPGLQARARDGRWIDVPPQEGVLAVNFGQVLERWSAGRIRATEHRVIGMGEERFSIPFFYEARADAEIRPLPGDDPKAFEPFLYGDYLWERMVEFVEFRGMQGLRPPQRGASAKMSNP